MPRRPKQPPPICIQCGKPRPLGGKAKSGVCQKCFRAIQHETKWMKKLAMQHAADRDAQKPNESWWMCPRDRWSDRIAEHLPRFHAMGVGKLHPVIDVPAVRRGTVSL